MLFLYFVILAAGNVVAANAVDSAELLERMNRSNSVKKVLKADTDTNITPVIGTANIEKKIENESNGKKIERENVVNNVEAEISGSKVEQDKNVKKVEEQSTNKKATEIQNVKKEEVDTKNTASSITKTSGSGHDVTPGTGGIHAEESSFNEKIPHMSDDDFTDSTTSGFYFFVGISGVAIAVIMLKVYRMRLSRAERKYGVQGDRTTQELTPLPVSIEDINSDEDDQTLFEINRQQIRIL